jgi:hypothetical protein
MQPLVDLVVLEYPQSGKAGGDDIWDGISDSTASALHFW